MHKKFGVYTRAMELTERELALWLQLRISMIEEELNELKQAHFKRDAEGVIAVSYTHLTLPTIYSV